MIGLFSKFKDSVKYVDFLAYEPKLRIQNNTSYKTIFGGFISLVILILSWVGTIYFGQELWQKKSPVGITSVEDFPKVGPFNVGEKDFNIYLAVEYANFSFYTDPRVFNFYATTTYVVNETLIEVEIESNLCSKYYNDPSELSTKVVVDIELFYCVKPNITYVSGFWGSPDYVSLAFYLHKCVNSTENNNSCLPQDEIDELIQGGIFAMYVSNSDVVMSNYSSPIRKELNDIYNSLNTDLTYDYTFFLEPLQFSSDSGFLLPNIDTIVTTQFDPPSILYYGSRGSLISRVSIEGSPTGLNISRSYLKFQDILTRIGGLIKVLQVIGTIFSQFASEIEFYNDYLHNILERKKKF